MQTLVDVFFRGIGLVFPYIHEHTFRTSFAQVQRRGFKQVRRTWLALLNMIFAQAKRNYCPGDDFPERSRMDSYLFYSRALSLSSEVMLQAPNLETGMFNLNSMIERPQ